MDHFFLKIECQFSDHYDLRRILLHSAGAKAIELTTSGRGDRKIRWREPGFAMAIYLVETKMWSIASKGTVSGYKMCGPIYGAPVSSLGEQWGSNGWIETAFTKPLANQIFPDCGNRNGRSKPKGAPRMIGFSQGAPANLLVAIHIEGREIDELEELNNLRLAVYKKGSWRAENFGWADDWTEQMKAIQHGFVDSVETPKLPTRSSRTLPANCYPLNTVSDGLPFFRPPSRDFAETPFPTYDEILVSGGAPVPAILDSINDSLRVRGHAVIVGAPGCGKNVAAGFVIKQFRNDNWTVLWANLGSIIAAGQEPELLSRASEMVDERVLIIVDDVQHSTELYRQLRAIFPADDGRGKLLSLCRGNHQGREQTSLQFFENSALEMVVTPRVIRQVVEWTLACTDLGSRVTEVDSKMCKAWHVQFGGNLAMLQFALLAKVNQLRRGPLRIDAADAREFIYSRFIEPFSRTERQALRTIAALAEIGFDTPHRIFEKSELKALLDAGVVVSTKRSSRVATANKARKQKWVTLSNPQLAAALLASDESTEDSVELRLKVASESPFLATSLAAYYEDRLEHGLACEALHASIGNGNPFPSIVRSGLRYATPIVKRFERLGVLERERLEHMLVRAERDIVAALSLNHPNELITFLRLAKERFPRLLDKISGWLIAPHNMRTVVEALDSFPYTDLAKFRDSLKTDFRRWLQPFDVALGGHLQTVNWIACARERAIPEFVRLRNMLEEAGIEAVANSFTDATETDEFWIRVWERWKAASFAVLVSDLAQIRDTFPGDTARIATRVVKSKIGSSEFDSMLARSSLWTVIALYAELKPSANSKAGRILKTWITARIKNDEGGVEVPLTRWLAVSGTLKRLLSQQNYAKLVSVVWAPNRIESQLAGTSLAGVSEILRQAGEPEKELAEQVVLEFLTGAKKRHHWQAIINRSSVDSIRQFAKSKSDLIDGTASERFRESLARIPTGVLKQMVSSAEVSSLVWAIQFFENENVDFQRRLLCVLRDRRTRQQVKGKFRDTGLGWSLKLLKLLEAHEPKTFELLGKELSTDSMVEALGRRLLQEDLGMTNHFVEFMFPKLSLAAERIVEWLVSDRQLPQLRSFIERSDIRDVAKLYRLFEKHASEAARATLKELLADETRYPHLNIPCFSYERGAAKYAMGILQRSLPALHQFVMSKVSRS